MRSIIDFGLVVLIWIVQLIIYPSFQYFNPAQLAAWHPRYSNLITVIVGPLMVMQVVAVGLQLYQRPSWQTLLSALLVGLMWISTAFSAVPLHNAIAGGDTSAETLSRLVTINWVRTVGWTAIFLLGLRWER